MATSKKKAGPRPTRSVVEIEQKGLATHRLLVEHGAALMERLPAGVAGGLAADLGSIGVVVPGAVTARLVRKGATRTQTEAAEEARDLIMGIRQALVAAGASKATRVAYGEGSKVSPRVVKSVLGAGKQILERAEALPEELREAGVLGSDVDALREALAETDAADSQQEASKRDAVDATLTRNATLVRIERTVKRVAAAGALAFRGVPDVRQRFEALVAPAAKAKSAPV